VFSSPAGVRLESEERMSQLQKQLVQMSLRIREQGSTYMWHTALGWKVDNYLSRFLFKPPLELDILRKLYYLRKEINCFRILFAC